MEMQRLNKIARGIVFSGVLVSSAKLTMFSKPKNAKMISAALEIVADVGIADSADPKFGFCQPNQTKRSKPHTSIVVKTAFTQLDCLIPMTLIPVKKTRSPPATKR
ncbi:MAG: hypothetical protein AABY64_01950 [Bdellovibrionota bacterium]